METLKAIKEQLVSCVQGQMGDLSKVNAKELGEVVDMIKDLAETMYYCSVTEAMDDAKENEEKRSTYYYMEKYLPYYPYSGRMPYAREEEYGRGRMYYDGDGRGRPQENGSENSGAGGRNYYEDYYPMAPLHDEREGRSGARRRMYMESKAMHEDQTKKIQELESYMKELTSDITEMIQDASPEEKAVLQKKVNMLATKLQNV